MVGEIARCSGWLVTLAVDIGLSSSRAWWAGTGQYVPMHSICTDPALNSMVVIRPRSLGSFQNLGAGRPNLLVIRISWPPTLTVAGLSVGAMRTVDEGPMIRLAARCRKRDSARLHLVSVMNMMSMACVVIRAMMSFSLSSVSVFAFIVLHLISPWGEGDRWCNSLFAITVSRC